jgi:hypothetical protein
MTARAANIKAFVGGFPIKFSGGESFTPKATADPGPA